MGGLATDHARRIQSLDPGVLRKILSDQTSTTRDSSVTTLHWGAYKPLTQVRKTFPDIKELAEDIAQRGMLNPQTVYAFPRNHAERYVRAINVIWGATDTLENIPVSMFHGNEVFYILIAGERRFRALEYLWNHGCSTCKTNHGNEQTGTCFFRHFPHGMIAANVKVGFTPYDALTDQFAENTHHRPKPDEEAIGFRVFFQLLRVREPKLTIAEFARRIGHHEQRVRTALQYTNLPDFVQQAVAEGKITYSTAVALERYHRVRCSTEDLKYWLTRAIAEADISSAKLAGLLHEDLHHWKASQRGLFGNAITALEEQHIRRVFDRSIAKALERMEGFLYAAIHAYRERHIGFSDSPFAAGSVRRAVLKIYRLLETLLPEIREGYTRRETEEIESIRSTLEDDLNWLEQHQED